MTLGSDHAFYIRMQKLALEKLHPQPRSKPVSSILVASTTTPPTTASVDATPIMPTIHINTTSTKKGSPPTEDVRRSTLVRMSYHKALLFAEMAARDAVVAGKLRSDLDNSNNGNAATGVVGRRSRSRTMLMPTGYGSSLQQWLVK